MSDITSPADYEGELSNGLEVAKEFLPPRARRLVYACVSILGYLLGAAAIGFAAAGVGIPTGIIVATSILGYLIGPIGQLAASNTIVVKSGPTE